MEARNSLPEIQGSSHYFKTILPSTLEAKMLYMPKTFWVECLSKEVKQIKRQDCDRKEWPMETRETDKRRLA
ncbi:hypothetical protein Patl1_35800 [Pistacia atlantica]|nr:hypothetical protein Patl1_35800 [Pistacia atlantica]